MKPKRTIILLLLIIPFLIKGQEADSIKKSCFKKVHVSVDAGAHYNLYYKSDYMPHYPSSTLTPSGTTINKFDRSKVIPTNSFQFGFMVDYNFYKKFSISIGIMYFNRRRVIEGVAADTTVNCINDGLCIKRVEYNNNNIETPFYLGCKIKKISVQAGCSIGIFLPFVVEKETFVNGKQWKEHYSRTDISIYLCSKINYTINFKRIKFGPYGGFQMGGYKYHYYYLMTGLNIYLK